MHAETSQIMDILNSRSKNMIKQKMNTWNRRKKKTKDPRKGTRPRDPCFYTLHINLTQITE